MVANHPSRLLPGQGNKVEIRGMSAAELIGAAYQVPPRELVGPSWMSDTRFDIDALMPEGQSRSKAPEMLLTLLQDRLGLIAHRETRRMSGYILSVGKDGPKLKETGPPVPTKDMPNPTSGPRFNGLRFRMGHGNMHQLAETLAAYLQGPVEDRTELKGFYEIEVKIPNSERNDDSDQLAAFREALSAYGLHLASGKIDVPVVVVDNLAKVPVAN
jgi:uncharacterized protein (TIGR03435 family)